MVVRFLRTEVICSSRPAVAGSTEVCPRLLGKPRGGGEQLFTALCPSIRIRSRPLGNGVFGPLLVGLDWRPGVGETKQYPLSIAVLFCFLETEVF